VTGEVREGDRTVEEISEAGLFAKASPKSLVVTVNVVLAIGNDLLPATEWLSARLRHRCSIPRSTHAEQGICLEQRNFLRVHSTQEYAGRGRFLIP
jgi:hypothetical protein